MSEIAYYIGKKKRRAVTVEEHQRIMVDRAAGKANAQAVFFGIGDARAKARKYGIVCDYDGEMAKRML